MNACYCALNSGLFLTSIYVIHNYIILIKLIKNPSKFYFSPIHVSILNTILLIGYLIAGIGQFILYNN